MGALYREEPYNEEEFKRRIFQETQHLKESFEEKKFNFDLYDAGYELEFQLVDNNMNPAHENLELINTLNKKFFVPEVYRSVVEINSDFFQMNNRGLARTQNHLKNLWEDIHSSAQSRKLNMIGIGTLPTFQEKHIGEDFLTPGWRYKILNDNIRRLQDYTAKIIHIKGKEELKLPIDCVSLMGALCAFHIHLRIPENKEAEYYNASLIASAPLLAMSTNSPYLLGKELWHETRIPLFEQIINLPHGQSRVTFGKNYISSYYELFQENLKYKYLLPFVNNQTKEKFYHVALHNGTLWRWNRPVIGEDKEGRPHLRIENRVLPASTSIIDSVANVAFYVGLLKNLVDSRLDFKQKLPFKFIKNNFYNAAKHGMNSQLHWLNDSVFPVEKLLIDTLIPMAVQGLNQIGIARNDIKEFQDILEARVSNKKTGSNWQIEFIKKNGKDFQSMLKAYHNFQQKNISISDWTS